MILNVFHTCASSFSNDSWRPIEKPENNLDTCTTKGASWLVFLTLLSRDVSGSVKSQAITWETPWVWAKLLPGVTRQSLALFWDCYNSALRHGAEVNATPYGWHQRHLICRTPEYITPLFPRGLLWSISTGRKCDQLGLLGMSVGWDLQSWIFWSPTEKGSRNIDVE